MKSLQRLWSQAIEGEEKETHTPVAGADKILNRTGLYYQNKQKSKHPLVLVGKNWWNEVI